MGRLARKEGWRKVNRLEEEPGRPGGRKGSTGVEVESTGDFEISLSQLETACDSQEKGTGISGVLIRKILFVGGFLLFLLKIASILREKGQLLTLEAKRRLAGSSKVLETSGKGKGKGKNPPIRSGQHVYCGRGCVSLESEYGKN